MARCGGDRDDPHDGHTTGQIVDCTGDTAQRCSTDTEWEPIDSDHSEREQHRAQGAASETALHDEHADQVRHTERDEDEQRPSAAVATVRLDTGDGTAARARTEQLHGGRNGTGDRGPATPCQQQQYADIDSCATEAAQGESG